MADQITSNTEALKLFFTEDIYLIPNEVLSPAGCRRKMLRTAQEVEALATVTRPYKFHGRKCKESAHPGE